MGIQKNRVAVITRSAQTTDHLFGSIEHDASICFIDSKRPAESVNDFVIRTLPDVVIKEIAEESDETEGVHLRQIASESFGKDFKVIYLIDRVCEQRIPQIYADGVLDILLETDGVDEITKAVTIVANGGHFLSTAVFNSLPELNIRSFCSTINGSGAKPGAFGSGSLSAREEAVLKLIAFGFSVKEIAAEMKVSTKTIETYKSRAADKLRLSTRASIVKYGMTKGWFSTYFN
ncbi:MAG: response regulator transcription factor [Phyllobacterium sp.]|uniref:helix-turn-helix transcriptional regulator n=1 Tax=Phyllobacterium sp. TaxID=1871046 RepID=UPI0030F138CF